jgi:hypothetical protein
VILAGTTAYRERGSVDARGLGVSLVGLAGGTVIGALILKVAPGPTLPKVFGILALIAVALSVLGFHIKASFLSLVLGGGAAGVMGTMVGIHGPPIALVFQHVRLDIARSMPSAFFGFACMGTVVALAAVGLFGWPELSTGGDAAAGRGGRPPRRSVHSGADRSASPALRHPADFNQQRGSPRARRDASEVDARGELDPEPRSALDRGSARTENDSPGGPAAR